MLIRSHPSSAVAVLPRAGLGNRMLVWARAEAFAYRNGLRPVTLGWGKRSLGPYLRRERTKRLYGTFFRSDPLAEAAARIRAATGILQWEPPFDSIVVPGQHVGFRDIPHWADSFEHIRECRPHITARLREVLRPDVWNQVERHPAPVIGVHVRRGDFSMLPPSIDFASVGQTRTPLDYFVDVIHTLRNEAGAVLPVTLFSDGYDAELAPLLALPNVRRAPASPDVVDLLYLARSRVIVVSAGSSFSMWSGFLSNAALLLHPDHIHAPIRPLDAIGELYEGPAPVNAGCIPPLLSQALGCLKYEIDLSQ